MSNVARGNIAESVAVIGTVDPDAYGTGATTSDIIDMSYWEEIMVVVMVGTLGTNATVDAVVAGSASSNMASSATITGKSITQLTDAGTDSDKQAIIRVTAEEVAAQGYRYVQLTMTVGTATSDAGAIILGSSCVYEPVAAYDLASVDEVIM